ncbi:MAG TPA: hypothetical protein VL860_12380, partial [Planctomycetota bacterium]|nr:hypothetical protein [Planctomycetota bacterium]
MSLPRFSPPLRALMLSCVILGLCSLAALPAFEALTAEAVAPPPEPAIPSPLPHGDPAGVLAAAINTRGPSNAATPTATAALPPPTDPFEKCLADLNEEDSTVRRQAAKNLRDGALLWQSRLEEALSRPELDPESRLVVRSIRNAIPRQRALQQLQQGTKIDLDLPPVTLRQALQALQSQAGVQFVTLDLELLESPICRSVQFRGSYWETLQYLSNRFVPAIAEAEPLPQNRPRSTPEEQQQMALRYRRQEQGLVPITPQTEEEESRDWRPTADLSMLHKLWRQPTRTLGPLCLQVDWIGWRMNLATGVETLGGKIVTTVEPGIDANKVDIDFARIDRASKPQPMVLSEDDLNGYALANHAWTFDEDLPPGEGGALVLRGNLSASVSDRGGELTVATDCHEPSGCSSSAVNCIVVPGSRMTDCNNPFSTLLPAKPDTANESAMLFCLAGNPDLAATLQQLISTQMRFEERSGKEIANPGYSVRQFSFGRQAWDASFATAYGTVPKDCTRIRLRYPLAAIQQTFPLITLDLSNTPVIADCQGDGTAADGGEYVICYNGWRRGRARVRRGGGSRSSFPSTTLGPIPTPLPPPPVPTAIDLAPWQAAAAYAHRVLTEGTPVALNLKDATFAEALLAIQGQSGGDLSEYLVLHSHLLTRRNLQFRGTYWEALHQAVELYLGRSPAAEDSDAEIDPCAAQ